MVKVSGSLVYALKLQTLTTCLIFDESIWAVDVCLYRFLCRGCLVTSCMQLIDFEYQQELVL